MKLSDLSEDYHTKSDKNQSRLVPRRDTAVPGEVSAAGKSQDRVAPNPNGVPKRRPNRRIATPKPRPDPYPNDSLSLVDVPGSNAPGFTDHDDRETTAIPPYDTSRSGKPH